MSHNRTPHDQCARSPSKGDTTALVVGKILRSRPKVQMGSIDAQGMILFSLYYRSLRITHDQVRRMSLLRRGLLADFLGRYLITVNLDDFMALIADYDKYPYFVRKYPLAQVGLYFDDVQMVFKFSVSILFYLYNEELAKWLEGEKANVVWSWDYLKRTGPWFPSY